MENPDEKLSTADIASPRQAAEPSIASEHGTSTRPETARPDEAELIGAGGRHASTESQQAAAVDAPEPGRGVDESGEVEGREALLADELTAEFRTRWEAVQARFVDEPRGAVEEADALVADLMQQLAETFSRERANLEGQWDRGGDVSTEELRIALRRYRSFFTRLLAT